MFYYKDAIKQINGIEKMNTVSVYKSHSFTGELKRKKNFEITIRLNHYNGKDFPKFGKSYKKVRLNIGKQSILVVLRG